MLLLVEVLSRGLFSLPVQQGALALSTRREYYVVLRTYCHYFQITNLPVFETGFITSSKYSTDIVCCCLTPGGVHSSWRLSVKGWEKSPEAGIYYILITEYYHSYIPCSSQATEANLRRKGQARGKFAGDAECYVAR